ncbi:MAG: paraquat-inducible protein A [Planctomycetes bacterium]|nr:paraquat-inducible protein A [Planctomycetota bacterium]
MNVQPQLTTCHCCGLIQQLPEIPQRAEAQCSRCHSILHIRIRSLLLSRSCAISALCIYPFAILLPIMSIEQLGHRNDSSIWSGTLHLFSSGSIGTGLIILLCSIVLPLCKLCGLLVISSPLFLHKKHRALTYRMIELSGRWGMLDVMLVAILVAIVKLGDSVSMQTGPGLSVFCLCVVLSLIASTQFDSRVIWENTHEQN